jgi:hypothetical protein
MVLERAPSNSLTALEFVAGAESAEPVEVFTRRADWLPPLVCMAGRRLRGPELKLAADGLSSVFVAWLNRFLVCEADFAAEVDVAVVSGVAASATASPRWACAMAISPITATPEINDKRIKNRFMLELLAR